MIFLCRERSRLDRELWDAGEVTGHLVPPGSVFAFLAGHRRHVAAEPDTGLITDCEMTMAAGDGSSTPRTG